MTQDELFDMAKEAGFMQHLGVIAIPNVLCLERFAALVAAAEREACAKAAEALGAHPALNVWNGGPDWYKHGKEIAAAIRARGEMK